MSIIHEALKKAGKDAGSFFRPHAPKREIEIHTPLKKRNFNWGPVFVLAVLFLISGPIVASIFSTPFQPSRFAAPTIPSVSVSSPRENLSPNPKPRFGIEEAPLGVPAPLSVQNPLRLSGIVVSLEGSYCILNDRVLKVGDQIDGARLVRITPEGVTLDYGDRKILVAS